MYRDVREQRRCERLVVSQSLTFPERGKQMRKESGEPGRSSLCQGLLDRSEQWGGYCRSWGQLLKGCGRGTEDKDPAGCSWGSFLLQLSKQVMVAGVGSLWWERRRPKSGNACVWDLKSV